MLESYWKNFCVFYQPFELPTVSKKEVEKVFWFGAKNENNVVLVTYSNENEIHKEDLVVI